jgi:hypothetical protein
LRIRDEIRFDEGVSRGMVGGSWARATTPGAWGTTFVSGRAKRAMTATVIGGALGLLTVACGGSSQNAADKPHPTTTHPTTSTTLNPAEAAKQAVIKARDAADKAEIKALGPQPNPDLPALADTHTGLMLDRLKQTAKGLRLSGAASRLPANSKHRLDVTSVRLTKVSGQDVAYLEVCMIDDVERVQTSTGKVLLSGLFTFQSSEAMKKVDGVWRLAERRQNSAAEGVAGCAVK